MLLKSSLKPKLLSLNSDELIKTRKRIVSDSMSIDYIPADHTITGYIYADYNLVKTPPL